MDTNTIAIIATAVLTILSFLGVLSVVLKKVTAVKESVDVVHAVLITISDGKVDPEEVAKIKKEIEEAKAAWKS